MITPAKTPMPHDYARRVKIFHSVGIQINGSFVLGFDTINLMCLKKLSPGSKKIN